MVRAAIHSTVDGHRERSWSKGFVTNDGVLEVLVSPCLCECCVLFVEAQIVAAKEERM